MLHDADISESTEEISYDKKGMKLSFALFHYPAYFVIFAFVAAIIVLITVCVIQSFRTLDTLGILGLTFCFAVMIFLLVVMITFFVKTHKLYKEVDCNLTSEYSHESCK